MSYRRCVTKLFTLSATIVFSLFVAVIWEAVVLNSHRVLPWTPGFSVEYWLAGKYGHESWVPNFPMIIAIDTGVVMILLLSLLAVAIYLRKKRQNPRS